jgi:hypothetical protein
VRFHSSPSFSGAAQAYLDEVSGRIEIIAEGICLAIPSLLRRDFRKRIGALKEWPPIIE